MIKRNRTVYFILIIITVILGLGTRKYSNNLNSFIAEYSGDTLWAMMLFFIFGFIFSKYSTLHIALLSLLFSWVIEFSQLYQANWINAIRSTKLGGLVLGYGFLFSDLVCYSAGIFIGVCLEKYVFKRVSIIRETSEYV
ncbi:MAG TPA: DUF2809 domain-containing protein [Ignavibacteria bacterium]|nr:DUF2809 domain-containing protein [Ignavibacteria bacterium]